MTMPMVYQQDDYAHAVSVPRLSLDRQARLVAHIQCRNRSLSSQPAVSLGVARSAAALLAADPDRLSGPTALAQAEALAQATQFGPALMQIQSSLMVLAAMPGPGATVDGLHAAAMGRILWNLIDEASSLLDRLGSQSNWRWSADK